MNPLLPLNSLARGQLARVARVVGRPDQVHRLEEFGLRLGTWIQMFLPGNPCIVRMAGSKLCLRVDKRLNILVEPAPMAD